MNISRRTLKLELIVFIVLLLLAVASRFTLADIPNFKPVAACALLSGFLFSRFWLAIALPILVMFVSDSQIGSYDAMIMFAVYGSLALCPLIGWAAAKLVEYRSYRRAGQASVLMFSALAMSVLFFLLTNFAVWTQWYDRSWQGLVACFASALPFFKYTLLGNLFFTASGLVGYWFVADAVVSMQRKKLAARCGTLD